MKKIIVALLTLTMLLSLAVPAFAAEAVNPADAKDGDLIYTVDFRGDDVFKPEHFGADSSKKFVMTPSEDGTTLNIKGLPEAGETGSGYWGGVFKDITLGKDGAYTMVYKVRANGTVGKNNSIGVGALIIDKLIKQNTMFYCNYGNYNTQGEGGDVSMRRSSLSKGSTKITKEDETDYIMWDTIGAVAQDADGFVTCMVEYDATGKEMSSYVLATGDGSKYEDWTKLETQTMPTNMVTDAIGLKLYICYTVVDSDLKDVQLYKGFRVAHPVETTAAPETDAPTQPETTEAPVAETEPEVQEAAGGCGGTVTVAGMAIIAALGTCAVVTSKKRR